MSELLLTTPWYMEAANWIAFLKAAFGVGLVIFVHELGHFLVAKACGVKCEKFLIGFDPPIKIGPIKLPRTLLRFKYGETEYGIGIIPLGGYVKMLGQDDNPANAAAEAERTKIRKEKAAEGGKGEAEVKEAPETRTEEYELDPRSYPAKSVPQRMAIISAGVIMNVITAVIFAALAYGIGVKYTPCIVGDIVPGAPAWNAGLRPGDRIVQVGDREISWNMRWQDDLLKSIAFAPVGEDLTIKVDRPGDEELVTLKVKPKKAAGRELGTVGILAEGSLKLDTEEPTVPGFPAAEASPAFQGGDRIVAVNGQPIETNLEWESLDLAHQDESLTVTVERAAAEGATLEQVDITMGPTPLRGVGVQFAVQPLSNIRAGWPADQAGLKEGDLILKVNGEEIIDALLLPHQLRRLASQPTTLEIQRGQNVLEVKVTPQLPETYSAESQAYDLVSLSSIGAVFPLQGDDADARVTVAGVVPGSPAEEAGLQAGDVITAVQFVPTAENQSAQEDRGVYLKEIDLDEQPFDWLFVADQMTALLPDTKVKLTWFRGSGDSAVWLDGEMVTTPLEGYHSPTRGVRFVGLSEIHQAGSAGEAIKLGFRQTKEDFLEVFKVFYLLATGQLSPKALGGPGTIAVGATMEATEGVARLLLFMTLISVNLAIINFLPIPVLDGGHMVFLLYEGIKGKPVDEKIAFRLTLAGLSFILALMVFVLSLDAMRLGGLLFGWL